MLRTVPLLSTIIRSNAQSMCSDELLVSPPPTVAAAAVAGSMYTELRLSRSGCCWVALSIYATTSAGFEDGVSGPKKT